MWFVTFLGTNRKVWRLDFSFYLSQIKKGGTKRFYLGKFGNKKMNVEEGGRMKGLCSKWQFFPHKTCPRDENAFNVRHFCPPANFLEFQPFARRHVACCGPRKLGTSIRPPRINRAQKIRGQLKGIKIFIPRSEQDEAPSSWPAAEHHIDYSRDQPKSDTWQQQDRSVAYTPNS